MKFIYPHITQSLERLYSIFLRLIILFIFSNKLYSQQFNNWIFHNNNGLTFNTNPPSFIAGGLITNKLSSYSTASISDNSGNLLFYSDGERVGIKIIVLCQLALNY